MKKSELRNIIKEEIKSILGEAKNKPPTSKTFGLDKKDYSIFQKYIEKVPWNKVNNLTNKILASPKFGNLDAQEAEQMAKLLLVPVNNAFTQMNIQSHFLKLCKSRE